MTTLVLEPAELGFKRPFTKEVNQTLRLSNTTENAIAFKVKTTAPKQYCVRPNSGTVQPHGSVEVSVVLQPMKQDPAPDARCRDKFLVQSVSVPAHTALPPWGDLEKAPDFAAMVEQRKIKVQYLPAEGDEAPAHEAAHTNGVDDSTILDDTSVMTSPPPSYTPLADAKSEGETTPKTATSDDGLRRRAPDSSDSLTASAASTAFSAAPSKKEDESSIPSRVRDVAGSALQQAHQHQPGVAGVPVPTVALLCFFVFLLTYFIF